MRIPLAGKYSGGQRRHHDTALGTISSGFVSEHDANNPLYDKFTPPEEFLNADGTGNSHALIEAAIDLGRREVAEGSVLLKNNGALPLGSGSNVTLFGIRSHSNLLGSSFGVKAFGGYISLEQALSKRQNRFCQHHRLDRGFPGRGQLPHCRWLERRRIRL